MAPVALGAKRPSDLEAPGEGAEAEAEEEEEEEEEEGEVPAAYRTH